MSEPKTKKVRMRKATFVELEDMETEKKSEEDEDTDWIVQVPWWDPSLTASNVHSSSVIAISWGHCSAAINQAEKQESLVRKPRILN